jgi:hypothetical protein
MRIIVSALQIFGAHFSPTALVPAPALQAWVGWSFAATGLP